MVAHLQYGRGTATLEQAHLAVDAVFLRQPTADQKHEYAGVDQKETGLFFPPGDSYHGSGQDVYAQEHHECGEPCGLIDAELHGGRTPTAFKPRGPGQNRSAGSNYDRCQGSRAEEGYRADQQIQRKGSAGRASGGP